MYVRKNIHFKFYGYILNWLKVLMKNVRNLPQRSEIARLNRYQFVEFLRGGDIPIIRTIVIFPRNPMKKIGMYRAVRAIVSPGLIASKMSTCSWDEFIIKRLRFFSIFSCINNFASRPKMAERFRWSIFGWKIQSKILTSLKVNSYPPRC